MGYVTVKFLGEEYEVSETINEYLDYENILTPIRTKILDMLITDVNKDSKLVWDNNTAKHIRDTSKKYRDTFEAGAELLVKKLLELGIYDVTSKDLLENVTAINDMHLLEKNTYTTFLEEGEKFVELQNAGIENAYNSAANNITGSGVRIFTSSISALMIHSAVEKRIVLSQAKKADKEYAEAVRSINTKTSFNLDKLSRQIMLENYYPTVIQIFLDYNNTLMSSFLVELTTHEKFDFESVEKYNMLKATDMLKNINQVSDKIEFLKQTFLTCPFGSDVYEKCLELGLLDKDTFETAKYFGMGEELAEKMDNYIKNNLNDSDKIKPIISILSSYRETDEISIWKGIYKDTLDNVADTYKTFNSSVFDKKKLDQFIRKNIIQQMSEIVDKSKDDIYNSIDKMMNDLITEKQYDEFVRMGILSPDTIRMADSTASTLCDINDEIREALVTCIMEYIKEAKIRLESYNQAKKLFDKEVEQKEDELNNLKSEKEKLGLFAFSKKKEISAIIKNKAIEISEFKKTNEPNNLLQEFERMYS